MAILTSDRENLVVAKDGTKRCQSVDIRQLIWQHHAPLGQ